MNHFYRLLWSHSKGVWLAVGELSKSQGKKTSCQVRTTERGVDQNGLRLRRSILAVACSLGVFSPFSNAAPLGGQISKDQGDIASQGAITTISQSSQRLDINWQSFNVTKDETVNFNQPGRSSLAVNHIQSSNGSEIQGRINANGQVWLLNPNGVLFSKTAQVNVGALLASALQESGNNTNGIEFSQSQGLLGAVKNLGNIRALDGGYVAFIGEQVENHGAIEAKFGTVAMGAGNKVRLTFSGSDLLSLQVAESTLDNLASNHGLIRSEGGQVLMNAGAKDSVLASVVNNTGIIEAQSVLKKEGKIVLLSGLSAGTTRVAGSLDASAKDSGTNGGFIETSGLKVLIDSAATITTYAGGGRTGTWLIDPKDYTIAASGGDETGSALGARLAANNIVIQTTDPGSDNGDIIINDSVSWSSGNTLTLDAQANIHINQSIDATAGAGGKLMLKYGQASASGTGAGYFINAAVNLQAGKNYVTQAGSGGTVINYQVITDLGSQGSITGLDLQGMNGKLSRHYALGANIDATATASWNGGSGFDPIGSSGSKKFKGHVDGLGHSITNLSIDRASEKFVGLIGWGLRGRISNINLLGADIRGKVAVGGLVGRHDLGLIVNNHVQGRVRGTSQVGGLVGRSKGTDIVDASASGNVVAKSQVGGLVGVLVGGSTVIDSFASTSVQANKTNAGGLVGFISNGNNSIENSYASGNVTATKVNAGGLVGLIKSSGSNTISGSFASGNVSAKQKSGGLIGFILSGTNQINNSYSSSNVTATKNKVGGFIGMISSGTNTINNSYSTGSVSGNRSGGFIGLISNGSNSVNNSFWDVTSSGLATSAAGLGKTTAQLRDLANYSTVGWSIDDVGSSNNVWRIYDGYTYPLLRGMLLPLDLAEQNVIYDGSAHGYNLVNNYAGLISADLSQRFINVNDDSSNSGIYSQQHGYDISGAEFNIIARTINLSAERQYDGSGVYAVAEFSSNDLVAGTLLSSILSGSGSTSEVNRGSAYNLDVNSLSLSDSNYTLVGGSHSAEISARIISLNGSRQYDGSTIINAADITSVTLIDGVELSDILTGTGSIAAVDANSYSLNAGGLNSSDNNYTFDGGSHSVNIVARVISLNGSRQYDGGGVFTANSFVSTDLVSGTTLGSILTGSGNTSETNAGSGYSVGVNALSLSDSNYTLAGGNHVANIDARLITISGRRQYDGSDIFSGENLILSNLVNGESLSVFGTAKVAFSGVGEQQLQLGSLSLSSDNYSIAASPHTVTIDPRLISVQTLVDDKIFDGQLAASVSFIGSDDFVGGDAVSVEFSSALFSAEQGVDQIVTVAGLQLSGNDAENYQLNETVVLTTASIISQDESGSAAASASGQINQQPVANVDPGQGNATPVANDNGEIDFSNLEATAAGGGVTAINCGGVVAGQGSSKEQEDWAKSLGAKVSENGVNVNDASCAGS